MDPLEQFLAAMLRRNKSWWGAHQAARERVLDVLKHSWLAITAIATVDDLPAVAVHRLMMWQSVRLYQNHAVVLILDQQLDGGMALLRMATELTRDMVFIGDDVSRLDLWLRRSDKAAQRQYRKAARFDESDAIMSYVKKTYDLTSTLGVHSHVTAASQLEVTDSASGVVRLEVEDRAVARSFSVWASSFAPIQLGCASTFLGGFGALIATPLQDLRKAGDALHKAASLSDQAV